MTNKDIITAIEKYKISKIEIERQQRVLKERGEHLDDLFKKAKQEYDAKNKN